MTQGGPLSLCRTCGCPPKDTLSTADIALAFGVCQRTVCNWIAVGRIQATRFGRKWRVNHFEFHQDLERASNLNDPYLASHARNSA